MCARTSRRTLAGGARQSTNGQRDIRAMAKPSGCANASRRHSAGSRRSPASARPSSESWPKWTGPSPLPPPTTSCVCPSSSGRRERPGRLRSHRRLVNCRLRSLGSRVSQSRRTSLSADRCSGLGEFGFGALTATAELEYGRRIVFFHWGGFEEGDAIDGNGSAEPQNDGCLLMELSFADGDHASLTRPPRNDFSTACERGTGPLRPTEMGSCCWRKDAGVTRAELRRTPPRVRTRLPTAPDFSEAPRAPLCPGQPGCRSTAHRHALQPSPW